MQYGPPDGSHIISVGQHTMKVWDSESGTVLYTFGEHNSLIQSVVWSPDGRRLATENNDNTVTIWSSRKHVPLGILLPTTTGTLSGVEWSPDGLQIAGGLGNAVQVWDARQGTSTHTLMGHTDWVRYVAWSPDGKLIVSISHDKTAKIWNANDGTLLHTLEHEMEVETVSWSPDGTQIASAGDDNLISIWTVSDGALFRTIDTHAEWIIGLSWSPEGTKIVGGGGFRVSVWDSISGSLLQTYWHNTSVSNAVWSPDGELLATVGNDNTIRIWDGTASSVRPLHTLRIENLTTFSKVAWSPDGVFLATGLFDGTIRIWGIPHK